MKLARAYPHDRLEAACRRALASGALSYTSVNSILKAGLDRLPLEEQRSLSLPARHVHLRGPDYYRNGEGV